jgi:hypothetical protein
MQFFFDYSMKFSENLSKLRQSFVIICIFYSNGFLLADPSDVQKPDSDEEILKKMFGKESVVNHLQTTGASFFIIGKEKYRSHFYSNTDHITSKNTITNSNRLNIDLNVANNTKITVKPRLDYQMSATSKEHSPSIEGKLIDFQTQEAYLESKLIDSFSVKGGYTDFSSGYAQFYNPANLIQNKNVSSDPNQEIPGKLSVQGKYQLTSFLTFDTIVYTDQYQPIFHVYKTDNSSTTSAEPPQPTYAERVNNSFNEKYNMENFVGSKSNIYGGKKYSSKSQVEEKNGSEYPAYGVFRAFADDGRFHSSFSVKGANRLPASFSSSAAVTLFDNIMIYGEGSIIKGRNYAIPILTGSGTPVVRLTDPVLLDRGESYKLVVDQTDKQYQFMHDNISRTTTGILGVQWSSLFNVPITLNLEYIYDGNGYTKEEMKTYFDGLRWAANLGGTHWDGENNIQFNGLNESGNTTNYKIRDLNTYKPDGSGQYLKNTSPTGSVIPPYLGQHYALFQLSYQPSTRALLIFRHIESLNDESRQEVFYGNYNLNDEWGISTSVLYNWGKDDSEWKQFYEKSIRISLKYSW